MTLGETQARFAQDIARLILWAGDHQYRVTLGDAYRDPRVHGTQGEPKAYGRALSAHKHRLAVDLNLFQRRHGRWRYLTSTESHRPLGEHWKALNPNNHWGGDFRRADGNHYSRAYKGIA